MPVVLREDHQEWLEIAFFNPSPYEKSGPAWPIRIGRNTAKPNYHIGPRTAPFCYLLIVLEGEGVFRQDGREHALGAGDLFALFPEVTHEYAANPDNPLRKIFLALDGRRGAELLARGGLTREQPHRRAGATEELIRSMEQFLEEAGGEQSDRAARMLLRGDGPAPQRGSAGSSRPRPPQRRLGPAAIYRPSLRGRHHRRRGGGLCRHRPDAFLQAVPPGVWHDAHPIYHRSSKWPRRFDCLESPATPFGDRSL